jgi:hypothetical protein
MFTCISERRCGFWLLDPEQESCVIPINVWNCLPNEKSVTSWKNGCPSSPVWEPPDLSPMNWPYSVTALSVSPLLNSLFQRPTAWHHFRTLVWRVCSCRPSWRLELRIKKARVMADAWICKMRKTILNFGWEEALEKHALFRLFL